MSAREFRLGRFVLLGPRIDVHQENVFLFGEQQDYPLGGGGGGGGGTNCCFGCLFTSMCCIHESCDTEMSHAIYLQILNY